MNPAVLKALLILAPTLLLVLGTAALYVRTKAAAALTLSAGAASLLIVVLAHVCEALNLLPFMGWGAEGSIGHYIDLASAIVGVVLLRSAFSFMCVASAKRMRPNHSLNPTARRQDRGLNRS